MPSHHARRAIGEIGAQPGRCWIGLFGRGGRRWRRSMDTSMSIRLSKAPEVVVESAPSKIAVLDAEVRAAVPVQQPVLGQFVGAAVRYWTTVFPLVCWERRRARRRARLIADPALGRIALDALHKWGNIEGACAYAAFVPVRRRRAVVTALAALQQAYNYLDMLAEHTDGEGSENARALHRALVAAVDPTVEHTDYYALHRASEDGGYLCEMIDRCRAALGQLPAYRLVVDRVRAASERIVEFQSASAGNDPDDLRRLADWSRANDPTGGALHWWEVAAAAGSSLCVYALIAAAGQERCESEQLTAIEAAYFPWIGALHSLLDNLVDVAEDAATGQRSLVGYYASTLEAQARMRMLTERARHAADGLAGASHSLVLGAMASFYLSAPEASLPAARPVAQVILGSLPKCSALAMLVFRVRLYARRARGGRRSFGAEVVVPGQMGLRHGLGD